MPEPVKRRIQMLWPLRHTGRRSELRTLVHYMRSVRNYGK